jgi:hypothetical protein
MSSQRVETRLDPQQSVGIAAGSVGNPFVHSLSVTLSNHTVHDAGTYNWPCPVGHLPICEMTLAACTGEKFP